MTEPRRSTPGIDLDDLEQCTRNDPVTLTETLDLRAGGLLLRLPSA
jgi:hypothetical protein